MGHDIHFLQRLDRVSLPHVELAMSLYHDPKLVAFVLQSAKLPEAAEKVAVSLDDSQAGPYLILTRGGHFVTCLGAGMRIDPDLPLITRSALDVHLAKLADYRDRVEQAHKLAGNRRVTGLLRRIHTAGDELSREEYVGLSAWTPLLLREFLAQMFGCAQYLERARGLLLPGLERRARKNEAAIRAYWNTFWALGHLALLVGDNIREDQAIIDVLQQELQPHGSTPTWGLTRQGFLPLALRGAWLAARMGRSALPFYKSAYRRAGSLLLTADTCIALTALAVRHSGLRGEILKLLPDSVEPDRTDYASHLARIGSIAHGVVNLYAHSPELMQQVEKSIAQRTYLRMKGHKLADDQAVPAEVLATIPDDQLVPCFANMPLCYLEQPSAVSSCLMFVPYVATISAEQFYFRQVDMAEHHEPWKLEHGLYLLRNFREHYLGGVQQPTRAESTPGRNDPCPCQSGKKYKRCCAMSPAPDQSPD